MALTPEQTKELRHLMGERRKALLAELRADAAKARDEAYGELAGAAPDAGDESVADLIQDLDQAELSRDLDELRGLEAAQARMAEGRYGSCTDCGAEIEFARLQANPGALRCIACQRTHEKTYAGTGRSSL